MEYTTKQLNNIMRAQLGEYTRRPINRAIRTWSDEKKLAWLLKFNYIKKEGN